MSNAGYSRIAARLKEIHLCGSRVAVLEDLNEKVSPNGLVALSKQTTVVGQVLAVGDKVEEDLQVGDLIVYEQWQGGRWLTEDGYKFLIMDEEKVALVLERLG
jgi:co-chaperonin GroES (HSP10)